MKLSKDAVSYEHPASKPENHCGVCRHFSPPRSCGIVAGVIRPEDWCKRFERRRVMAAQDRPWITNLEYDDEEMIDVMGGILPKAPQFPCYMKFCLTTREMEMFKMRLPRVGEVMDLRLFAEVTGVPSADRVEFQITGIKFIENEDEEDDGDDDE